MQVTFATRTHGPLQELTQRRERLTIEAYPLGRFLLLRGLGDVDGLEGAPEILASGRKVLHASRANGERTLLLDGHGDDEEVIARLADQDVHVLPPILWRRGEAQLSLLVDDGADLVALQSRFPQARLISKRTPKDGAKVALASPLFLPEMTEKQARALLAAANAGYYEFPRNATTEEVSTSLGVARSTFEQHLNRAEHHVVRAMLPIVRMRAGMPQDEALQVYSRFSRELGLYVRLEVLGDHVAGVSLSKGPIPASVGSDHPYLARILEHVRTGEDDLRDMDDPSRCDDHIRRDRDAARPPEGRARGRERGRAQPRDHRDPVPPRPARVRRSRELLWRRRPGDETAAPGAGGSPTRGSRRSPGSNERGRATAASRSIADLSRRPLTPASAVRRPRR